MTLIFGKSLIYWSGILTGILFVFTFSGCCFTFLKEKNLLCFFQKYHKLIIYLTLIFFLIHASLAILASNFGVYL